MKFSSSLKFNAVPEWWDEYIAYDALKKYIYQLEKEQHQRIVSSHHFRDVEEAQPLVAGSDGQSQMDKVFVPLLDRELKKVVTFYEKQEKEVTAQVDELMELVKEQEEEPELGGIGYTIDEEEEEEEDDEEGGHHLNRSSEHTRKTSRSLSFSQPGPPSPSSPKIPMRDRRYSVSSSEDLEDSVAQLRSSSGSGTLGRIASKFIPGLASSSNDPTSPWTSGSRYAEDTRLLFKRRITKAYVDVSSLRSYVDVNWNGFRKILKKYDKVTDSTLQQVYLSTKVTPSPPFTSSAKSYLTHLSSTLVDLYAKCVTRNDRAKAKADLKLHQRENIAWERNTVWRQMLGRERGATPNPTPRALGGTLMFEEQSDSDPEESLVTKKKTKRWLIKFTKAKMWFLIALILLIVLLNVETIQGEREASRCFAVLVFSTVLWASEAIPLFVTSLFVPLLLVTLRVIRSPEGERLSAKEATSFVFSQMFSPTIMLLIGGFTISSALSKTNIDRVLITRVLSIAGTRPRTVLLAFMGVSCFASMWISNVAAPTLCFALIKPILRTLPPKTNFAPCLILAIALSANIGGQASPISSPQNLIALSAMHPPVSWGQWFIVSIPVGIISILLIWLLLLVSYRPELDPTDQGEVLVLKEIKGTKEVWGWKQWLVVLVSVGTVAVWCVEKKVEGVVGDMGVVALMPIVIFFGSGVLGKDDFDQFAWTIVFLAMGGIALGKGVVASGLLEVLDKGIRDMVQGFSLYNVVLILSPVVLVISTFISHTIASVLLVPIADEVGKNLPGEHHNLLIFITALICSTGMGMPVSGFPNQTAATQEDDLGVLYLSNVDFLKNGIPASIIATLVASTVGYVLMRVIGL